MRQRALTAAAVFVWMLAVAAAGQERLVYETDSLYHHIIVSETPDVRVLRFHKGPAREALTSNFSQSAILLADPYALYMNYTKYAFVGAALADEPKRALFVGLGAGSLPKFYARAFPGCQVDVAEIDAKVFDVARKYFSLPEMPNLSVSIMDGRLFIKKTTNKYDLVVLDAYRDDMIPFHLMTREFLDELKAKLAPGGVVVSNICIASDAQLYPWVLRTYQAAFGTLLETGIPGSINKVLIGKVDAGAIKLTQLVAAAEALQKKTPLGYDLAECASGYRDVSSRRPSRNILTDDYAPVNLMRIRKADEKDWKY